MSATIVTIRGDRLRILKHKLVLNVVQWCLEIDPANDELSATRNTGIAVEGGRESPSSRHRLLQLDIGTSTEYLTLVQAYLLTILPESGIWDFLGRNGRIMSIICYITSIIDLYLHGRVDIIFTQPSLMSGGVSMTYDCEIEIISSEPLGNCLDPVLDSLEAWISESGVDRKIKLDDLLQYKVRSSPCNTSRYGGYSKFHLPDDDLTRCGFRPAVADMVARGIISSTQLGFFSRVFYWAESAYELAKPAIKTALIEALRSLIFSPDSVPGPTHFHLSAIIAIMDVKNLINYPINTAFGDSELVASKVLQSADDTSRYDERIGIIAKRNSQLRRDIFKRCNDSVNSDLLLQEQEKS